MILLSTKASRVNDQPSLTPTHDVTMSEDASNKADRPSKIKRTEFTEELMTFLREALIYRPENGELRWRPRPVHHFQNQKACNQWNGQHAGELAGCPQMHETGCPEGISIYFKINGRRMVLRAHRIIYSLCISPLMPGDEVDHKDRNPLNNLLGNLRLVTRSQNLHNIERKRRTGNPRGLPKGVIPSGKNKFASYIMVNYKRLRLGSFNTPEQAHEAYRAKSVELMGEHSAYFCS